MKKIPTIFKRDLNNLKAVTPEANPDCAWVFDGEGVATRKYDGTCCMVKDGVLWKRREIKEGQQFPSDFQLADFDDVTKKSVGWVPVTDAKEDRWHLEAWNNIGKSAADGTYELCGPKVQGNPENLVNHVLIPHSEAAQYEVPRSLDGIKQFLESMDIEGLVFHHPDGRMAKIKKRDFGLKRTHLTVAEAI
jgi:hypothetical protein